MAMMGRKRLEWERERETDTQYSHAHGLEERFSSSGRKCRIYFGHECLNADTRHSRHARSSASGARVPVGAVRLGAGKTFGWLRACW